VLQATPALSLAAVKSDPTAGYGGVSVQIQLVVRPDSDPPGSDSEIYAAKLMVYAPRVPANRVANNNPTLTEIDANGVAFADTSCLDVLAGDQLTLLPIEPAGVRETYVVPTFDGGSRTFTENMRYNWYATAGEYSPETSGGAIDTFGNDPPLKTTWTAPVGDELAAVPGGVVRFWLVMRDERGGTYWTERCFVVHN
jgi:hypothetical protein